MSLDPVTHRLVCDRCQRVESSEDELDGWALIDGKHVCEGCHMGAESEVEQAAKDHVDRLLADPAGRAILRMVLRDFAELEAGIGREGQSDG